MPWIDRYENPLNKFDTSVPWMPDPSIRTTMQWPIRPGVERLLRRAHMAARRRVHGWGEFAEEMRNEELARRLLPKLLIPAPTVDLSSATIDVSRHLTPREHKRDWSITCGMNSSFMEPLFVGAHPVAEELVASLTGDRLSVQIAANCTSRAHAEVVGQLWLEELEATMYVIARDHGEFAERLPATVEDAINVARGWLRTGQYATRLQYRL